MKKLIIANWKNYLSIDESIDLCNKIDAENNIIIAPSTPYLGLLARKFPNINFAAQDVSALTNNYGAFTGEIPSIMLKDLKISYALLGHSERRVNMLDNGNTISAKLKYCIESSITPIICIGETLEDRKSGNYKKVIITQLHEIFDNISTNINTQIIIAYEPFWSVGTGIPPQLNEIEEIIEVISKNVNFVDNKLFLVYGGSINIKNASSFISIPGLDGLLIGKASTDITQFKSISSISK